MTEARFAILSNGVDYQIYTDVDDRNKMDSKPFFEFNMLALDGRVVTEIKKFAKTAFNVDEILSTASELKYLKQIREQLERELDSPSEDLVRLLTSRVYTSRVYTGRFTEGVREQFSKLVQAAFKDFIRDKINLRLQSALEGSGQTVAQSEDVAAVEDTEDNDGIVTTPEEIEAFHIVKAMLAKAVEPSRIVMRDTKSYCGVLLDDNNRKPICRLRFNSSQKYIGLFDSNKNEERIAIKSLNDLYGFESKLTETVGYYDGLKQDDTTDSGV